MSNFGLQYFYAGTRQGEAARDVQQNERGKSVIQDAYPYGCGNTWATSAMAENPGMIPKGNYGSNAGGCDVNTYSGLLLGDPGTARMKGPKQVFARPFATTPFLGMGTLEHIDHQSRVIFGHSTANRKSIQTVTDKQFPVFEPLIPEKESDIAENNYFVEPFLRGGLVSRLIPKTRVDQMQ